MDPVQNRDQFTLQPQHICFLMKNAQHLNAVSKFKHKICIKANLRSILAEFQDFSSCNKLEIVTLLTPSKSLVVKNLPRNIILHFSAFCGS